MIIIDGKQTAREIRIEIKNKVASLLENYNSVPGLVAILVGENPASKVYVRAKERACDEVGFYSEVVRLPVETTEEKLLSLVAEYNRNEKINGILVQLPLPKHIDEEKIIQAISPDKDVDGFHPVSIGKMILGQETFLSCTPFGIMKLLEKYEIQTAGKHVVVVGRSNIVGKPIANMLLQKKGNANSIVTICHSAAEDISQYTKQADILIAAVGRPNFITSDMLKKDVVVIDVGINRVDDVTAKRGYKLVGDVDFENVSKKASFITPVPGGVGPMTIAMLLYNTYTSYLSNKNIKE